MTYEPSKKKVKIAHDTGFSSDELSSAIKCLDKSVKDLAFGINRLEGLDKTVKDLTQKVKDLKDMLRVATLRIEFNK